MLNKNLKLVSRKDAKAAKNGKNKKKVYCLNSRRTGISLRALRLCEKMICFFCSGLSGLGIPCFKKFHYPIRSLSSTIFLTCP